MLDLVTIGETLVAFAPMEKVSIRYASTFSKKIAGAESNVAIGVKKLGHNVGWISRLGKDELGEFVLREIRGEGVDTSFAIWDDEHPTGLMFKQSTSEETSVFYYRKGSAASYLRPKDLPLDYIKSAKILHITGITPALSESCLETIMEAIKIARNNNVKICFDPNIRLRLWNKEHATQTIIKILKQIDIALIGQDEGNILFGTENPIKIIEECKKFGVNTIAVKLGKEGAFVSDNEKTIKVDAIPTRVIDNVGAGDAFAAGFICGILEGRDIEKCGEMGCRMGELVISSQGDIEGVPDRLYLDKIMSKSNLVYR